MTPPLQPPRRRAEWHRAVRMLSTLGCALAWGLVELLALQRHRWQGLHRWRFHRGLPPRD